MGSVVTWLLVGFSVLAVLVGVISLVLYRAINRTTAPTREDRRRIAILAADPILSTTIEGLEPNGPVTSSPGGGYGPFVHSGQAQREYTAEGASDGLAETITQVAATAGWEIQSTTTHRDGIVLRSSHRDHGFGASLRIHIRRHGAASAVRIRLQTTAAYGSPSSRSA